MAATRDLTTASERVASVLADWESQGKSFRSLAETIGCTHATISQWRHGATNVENAKVGLMLRFADATGVSLEWLLTGDGPREATSVRYLSPEIARLTTELQAMEAMDQSAYRVVRSAIDSWAHSQPGDLRPAH